MKKRNDRSPHSNPVILYVNLLLFDMIARDEKTMVLKESSMPILQHKQKLPVDPPDFDPIVNRLKIMSGLNPVKYREPVDGTTSLTVAGTPYKVTTRFEDHDPEPFCTITLEEEGSQQ